MKRKEKRREKNNQIFIRTTQNCSNCKYGFKFLAKQIIDKSVKKVSFDEREKKTIRKLMLLP